MDKTLFVTFPRSGHHLLVGMLQEYYGDEMVYCENYSHCGQVWCPDKNVNTQKTHDLYLDVPANLNVKYIVQIRNWLDAIASWYVSATEHGWTDKPWEEFFEEKQAFYIKFIDKWVFGSRDKEVVTYKQLVTRPVETMVQVIGNKCDISKITDIVKSRNISQRHSINDYDFT